MATIQKNISVQNSQDIINLQDLFYLCICRWHWFVISLAVCLGISVWYLLITQPIYTRTASILIKDDTQGKSVSNDLEGFADLGIFSTNTNVNNEIGALKSPDLMRAVVSRLHLDMSYHVKGSLRNQTIYGEQLPVIVSIKGLPEDASASFVLDLLKDGSVAVSELKKNGETVAMDSPLKGKLNSVIQSPIGSIVVASSSAYTKGTESTIQVLRSPLQNVVTDFSSKLGVSQIDEKSNIITLTIKDVSPQRADDVLDALISVYNENWVKDKNQIAISTSMFINERLNVIERELGNVDNEISSYKSKNLLSDVQAAASMYMTQANAANVSVKELNDQIYMARYIRGYLTSDVSKLQLLPINSGIDNQSIAAQIQEYNTLLQERNSLVSRSGIKNPLVKDMDASLSGLREALVSSIDNQLVALNAQVKTQRAYGGQMISQIADNPKQMEFLLSVERQQKVKESLYLYLLQKREENELSQAFTAYNTRIISKPGGSMRPTSPIKSNILLVAFALGLFLPVVIIFVRENMNTVVRGRKDLENMTLPFVGEIPLAFRKKSGWLSRKDDKKSEKCSVVVEDKSRNVINEAFRVVRTNLEFVIGKEKSSHVIMITSANPGSGKTFISFNLATSLSVKGKRVLVIDLDLRKASLSKYVKSPNIGISDYLAEHVDDAGKIIFKPAGNAQPDVIPVGTIPPNPAELLFAERLRSLITDLQKEYDYIFIDCPPAEIVADAAIISKLADMTLFVVRAGLLERNMLPEIEKFYTDNKYRNMYLLLNGTDGGGGRYGYRYGYKYGYKYGYHYGYANNYSEN